MDITCTFHHKQVMLLRYCAVGDMLRFCVHLVVQWMYQSGMLEVLLLVHYMYSFSTLLVLLQHSVSILYCCCLSTDSNVH